jgi:uncharacterized protein with NAD-binding domain and iron-sulfur cluster
LWEVADVLLACATGILRHDLLRRPEGFDAVDDYDFAEWLVGNGASPESARSAFVKAAVYDLTFAYRDGNPARPAFSAGTALRGVGRMFFSYKGAIAWKMTAGMGDVVFAPLYELLRQRGVKFEFFHRVRALRPSADGRRVETIEIGRQAKVREGTEYDPLVQVKGLACWPAEPRYELLEHPAPGRDLESFWDDRPDVETRRLVAGTDFDKVVLAISLGALPFICGDLVAARPAWTETVRKVGTVQTQAFQLWLDRTLKELGCDWPPATTAGYVEPFDSYADMGQTIAAEAWPRDRVRGIAYFCNAMAPTRGADNPADREVPKRANDAVKESALRFLRNDMVHLWPDGVHRYPTDFKWQRLVGAPRGVEGEERFDYQYHRANVNPSDRYVMSLPGTTKHRLQPHQSGFENLYLAGDWTWCKLNAGCVEAAVISGMMAANAVKGAPPAEKIIGFGGP